MNEYEWTNTTSHFTLHVSKVGGGTVGKAYDGRWSYRLVSRGKIIEEGDDLYTGPMTHAEIGALVVDFVGLDVEAEL